MMKKKFNEYYSVEHENLIQEFLFLNNNIFNLDHKE